MKLRSVALLLPALLYCAAPAGDAGFKFLGVVVGKTAFGGKEVISLLQKVEK